MVRLLAIMLFAAVAEAGRHVQPMYSSETVVTSRVVTSSTDDGYYTDNIYGIFVSCIFIALLFGCIFCALSQPYYNTVVVDEVPQSAVVGARGNRKPLGL